MRVLLFALFLLGSCTGSENQSTAPMPDPQPEPSSATQSEAIEHQTITLGAGCFWCTEAVYEQLDGVVNAVSGYMGGHVEDPSYAEVCSKKSGHIEVTQLTFDPARIEVGTILGWFWKLHDPTSMDRQGADAGPQYRSAIFFHSEAQEAEAKRQIAAINGSGELSKPIVTEVRPAVTFWDAGEDHQDYYRKHPEQAYCRMVIAPKLKKLDL